METNSITFKRKKEKKKRLDFNSLKVIFAFQKLKNFPSE